MVPTGRDVLTPVQVSYLNDYVSYISAMLSLYRMMCSAYDVGDRRHFTRNCTDIYKSDPNRARSWTSVDLQGEYDGECPYYRR